MHNKTWIIKCLSVSIQYEFNLLLCLVEVLSALSMENLILLDNAFMGQGLALIVSTSRFLYCSSLSCRVIGPRRQQYRSY